MKKQVLILSLSLLATPLFAADTSPKDDVIAATKKLADQTSYSWKTTVTVPEGSRFRPGPTEGKTERGGYTYLKMSFRDNSVEAVFKGEKAAVTDEDGAWQLVSEIESDSPRRFIGGMVQNFKVPATEAKTLVDAVAELKTDGDVLSGDLTQEGAKALLTFRGRRNGNGPEISDAKGSVKFWIKDGAITKYEYHVTGKMDFNGNEREIDRTTTTEISDVGTTKLELPEAAKKKLMSTPPPGTEEKK